MVRCQVGRELELHFLFSLDYNICMLLDMSRIIVNACRVNGFFLEKNNFLFLNKPSKEKPESSLRKLAMQTNETTFDFERTGEEE